MPHKPAYSHWPPQLFAQLGGSVWALREDFKAPVKAPNHSDHTHEADKSVPAPLPQADAAPIESNQHHASHPADKEDLLSNPAARPQTTAAKPHASIVLIGAELNNVWQNEASLAWRLWQNIMKVFAWPEQAMVFFDTNQLVSESICEATIEEIIDLNVDWVLSMDPEHEFSQQVAEGIQVIAMPDFETLLADPYAKQTFYQTMLAQAN